MKQFSGLCKFAGLLLMLALPAVATAPIFVVNPVTPFVIAAGPGGCPSFDIAVVPQPERPNKGKLIVFADGSTIGHGATFVTATNLSNSKSINLNISGPTQFSVSDNTFTLYGATLNFSVPSNLLPPNLPTVSFAHGQTVIHFDNLGNIVSFTFSGTAQDVCESLQ